MVHHLRYSGLPFEEQRLAFIEIVRGDRLVREALTRARSLELPDWLLVSGALYNAVWNHLTGRPCGHGTKDFDLFYFDGSDLSWGAEDKVIARAATCFADFPLPVEVKNQARVHLWYESRFGQPYPQLFRAEEALSFFASRTHAVGVRFGTGDELDVVAPFGLDDIFSFRVTPNRALDNRRAHEEKGARAKATWPEIELVPW
jgi:hypothetical protein